MKRLPAAIAAILLVFSAGCQSGSVYANTTRVIYTDRKSDTVVCEDSVGNLWEFHGVEDWQLGDCASLVMSDMGTAEISDDEIISARYCAWNLE